MSPVVVRFDELGDGQFDGVDLLVEDLEHAFDAASRGLGGGEFAAVGLGGSKVDELTSAGDELVDFGLFFGVFFQGLGLDVLGKLCEEFGVEAIGFGELPESACEVADLAGIDASDAESGVHQGGDEPPLVSAGGFDHDETGAKRSQRGDDARDAIVVVGQRQGLNEW